MWRKALIVLMMIAVAILTVGSLASAQVVVQHDSRDDNANYNNDNTDDSQDANYDDQDYRDNYNRSSGDQIRVDRYLDAEVWTNRNDNQFYSGDNIHINYRVNRDAYVAIYSIDTRGRVHLLYPSQPGDNSWRRGGVTYSLPDPNDDYDLVVNGPSGTENITIVASRERFPIPNWYTGSGIICRDDDRDAFMDYLLSRYFTRYPGQRFAVDREVIDVNEWEQDYFRPVYYPTYPNWAVCGNAYIDYPWGGSIYVDGIYWGCAPLYIPTILVGWHTVTIYDPYGYCWEDNVHFSRYNTVVLNHTIIRPSNHVVSKYKEVREVGYRDPVRSGYPKYQEVLRKSTRMAPQAGVTRGGVVDRRAQTDAGNFVAPPKKFVRGSGQIVRTTRGYETPSAGGEIEKRSRVERKGVRSYDDPGTLDRLTPNDNSGTSERRSTGTVRPRTYDPVYEPSQVDRGRTDGGSSDYYQRKSGKVEQRPQGNSSNQRVEQGKKSDRAQSVFNRVETRERQAEQQRQQQVERKSSDNGGNRGGEVKQRSDGGNSKSSGNSGGSSRGGDQGGGRGKGRR